MEHSCLRKILQLSPDIVPFYFAAYGKSHPSVSEEVLNEKDANLNGKVISSNILGSGDSTHQAAVRNPANDSAIDEDDSGPMKRGMVLSFAPLSLTFHNIRYFVDMPQVAICL